MIFYFTGTGNSLATAQTIAEVANDSVVDIGRAFKYKDFDFTMIQNQRLGFVFPTYAWTTPSIIDAFIKHARFSGFDGKTFQPGYCFAVATCGSFVGNTLRFFGDQLLQHQGIKLDATFSVKTVGNCIYMYDPAQGAKRDQLLQSAIDSSYKVAEMVKAEKVGHFEHRNPAGILLSKITSQEEKPVSTESFFATDSCIGCGKCAQHCPTNTITILNDRPRWAEMGCTECLACLHRCPFEAIQYGKKTAARTRYLNPVLSTPPRFAADPLKEEAAQENTPNGHEAARESAEALR